MFIYVKNFWRIWSWIIGYMGFPYSWFFLWTFNFLSVIWRKYTNFFKNLKFYKKIPSGVFDED